MTLCERNKSCSIIDRIDQDYFYFIHTYYVSPNDEEVIVDTVEYGFNVTPLLHENNVFPTQFHPEKSDIPGLKMLKNFVTLNLYLNKNKFKTKYNSTMKKLIHEMEIS